MSEVRPWGLIGNAVVGEMNQTSRCMREPHVTLAITRNGEHSSARRARDGMEPVMLEISNRPDSGHPDPAALVLEKRTAREADTVDLVRGSHRRSGRRRCLLLPRWKQRFPVHPDVSIFPAIDAINGPKPDAAICRAEHRQHPQAREALLKGQGCDGKFAKAIEAGVGRHPDVPFAVLKQACDAVTRQAVRL